MKIIVGLGNPGRRYFATRHNTGFLVADEIAKSLGIEISKERHHSLLGMGQADSEKIVIAKPQTFMNETGRAVAAILRDVYSTPQDLIVIHDDLDLPLGVVRVKSGGGHGGHNGLRSIIEHLGSAEFVRVRIGIGRPPTDTSPADYVLSPFSAEEQAAAMDAIARAAEAVRVILNEGLSKAMNVYNQRRP